MRVTTFGGMAGLRDDSVMAYCSRICGLVLVNGVELSPGVTTRRGLGEGITGGLANPGGGKACDAGGCGMASSADVDSGEPGNRSSWTQPAGVVASGSGFTGARGIMPRGFTGGGGRGGRLELNGLRATGAGASGRTARRMDSVAGAPGDPATGISP